MFCLHGRSPNFRYGSFIILVVPYQTEQNSWQLVTNAGTSYLDVVFVFLAVVVVVGCYPASARAGIAALHFTAEICGSPRKGGYTVCGRSEK